MFKVCSIAQFAYSEITRLLSTSYKLTEVWARNVLEVCTAAQLAYNEMMLLTNASVAVQLVSGVEMFSYMK